MLLPIGHEEPAGHGKQVLKPLEGEYVPFIQREQVLEDDNENVPGRQEVALLAPASQEYPNGHGKHAL